MSAYTARGMRRFQADINVFSNGFYKLVTGSEVLDARPVALYKNGVNKDSTDQNKIWVEPYSDTSSISGTLGIAFYKKVAYSSTNDEKKLGEGDYRRDLSILHQGVYDMFFVSGAVQSATKFGMRIAPHPSGFVDWRTGLAYLGRVLEPGNGTGVMTTVIVEPENTEVSYI